MIGRTGLVAQRSSGPSVRNANAVLATLPHAWRRPTGHPRQRAAIIRLTNVTENPVARRLQVYETPDITVTFDPNLCIHSGNCVRGLPAVFDVRRKRWVRPEAASADQVEAQVARCPSGALQTVRNRP